MKKIIKTSISSLGIVLCVLMFSFKGITQTQFTMSIASVSATANTMDVTLTVTATNPSAGIRFGGFSAGINFSTAIINGGTISATYVGGRSASLSSLAANAISVSSFPGHIRLATSSLSGAQGVDMPQGTSLTLGTYRISNTANWTTSSNANLWLQNVIASQKTNSLVLGYPYGGTTPTVSYTTTNPASPAGLILSHTSTSTFSALLNATSGPTASVLSGSATICAGTSTNLSVAVTGGVSPYTVTVTDGTNNYSATGASPVSIAVSPTATSTYSIVSVTGGGTGTGNSGSAIVTVNQPTLLGSIQGATTICAGSTTTLSNINSGGTWSSSNTSVASINPSSGFVTANTSGSTTITYSYTNSNGCISSPVTTTVTVNQPTTLSPISGATSICAGSTTTLSNMNSGGGMGTWSSSNTSVANIGSYSGVVTANSMGTSGSTTITYSYTNSNGCISSPVTTTVTVNAPTSLSDIFGATSICAGSTTALSVYPSGGYWSSSNTSVASIDMGSGVVTANNMGMSGSTTITYFYTNSNGCASSKTTTVTVNQPTSLSLISGPLSICVGSTATFSNMTSGGTWSSSNTSVASIDPSSGVVPANSMAYTGSTTITYSYTNTNGCTSSTTRMLTVNQPTTLSPISGASSICAGSTTTLSNVNLGGTWSSSNTSVYINYDGVVTAYNSALGSTTITYSYTNMDGCTSSTTRMLTINQPTLLSEISAPMSICEGSTATLSNSTSGGTWSSSNTSVASINPSSGVVTANTSGSTTITYSKTNINGCISSVTTTVTVTAKPADIVTNATICSGATYTWSANTTGYTESQTVTITNDGCTANQVLNLTVTPISTNTTTASATVSYTWANNNQTYSTSGTYAGDTVNCVAQALDLTVYPVNYGDTIVFDLNQGVYSSENGVNYFTYPVKIKSTYTAINALDFWFKFNESELTFHSSTSTLNGLDVTSNFNSINHNLSTTASMPSISSTIPANTNIMTLKFIVNGPCPEVNTNDFFESNSLINGVVCSHRFSTGLPRTALINTTPVTACDSYAWNGTTYTASGLYTGTTANCVTEKLDLTITSQPTEPAKVNCWDTFTFNTTTCEWVNNNTPQPTQPANVNCWDTFTFNTTSCAWVNNNTAQPSQPAKLNCWDTFTFDPATCAWVNNNTPQPTQPANVNCWDTFTFDPATCAWVNNNTPQPTQPANVNCWDTFTFNATTCAWVSNNALQPTEPAKVNCWDTFTFDPATCAWVNNNTPQPTQPAIVNCWDTFTFNTTTCAWVNLATQPTEPAKVNCWDTFTFNTSTCVWDNNNTPQPTQPANVNCWDTFTFNTTTCAWVNNNTPQTVNTTTVSGQTGSYTWANNGQTYNTSGTYTGTDVNCVAQVLILTINASLRMDMEWLSSGINTADFQIRLTNTGTTPVKLNSLIIRGVHAAGITTGAITWKALNDNTLPGWLNWPNTGSTNLPYIPSQRKLNFSSSTGIFNSTTAQPIPSGSGVVVGTFRLSTTTNWLPNSDFGFVWETTSGGIVGYAGTATTVTNIQHYGTVTTASTCASCLAVTASTLQPLNPIIAPTAVLSGSAAICPGASTNLSVAVTNGQAPYTVTVTDGTNNYIATSSTSPLIIAVSPSALSTTYTISSLFAGIPANTLVGSGSATVTIQQDTTTVTGVNNSYTWANNGQTYTATGIYTGTVANCAYQVLNLTINPKLKMDMEWLSSTANTADFQIRLTNTGATPVKFNALIIRGVHALSPSITTGAITWKALNDNALPGWLAWPQTGTTNLPIITAQRKLNFSSSTGIFSSATAQPIPSDTGVVVGTFRVSTTTSWVPNSDFGFLWETTTGGIVGYVNNATTVTNFQHYGSASTATTCASCLTVTASSAQPLNPITTPIATLSGSATICAGTSTNLSVAVTGGQAPYTVTVTDGTNNYSATGASPLSIAVSPSATATYSISSITGGITGTGSGTAIVTITPLTTTGSVTTSICEGESYVWPLPNGTGLTYTTAQAGITNVVGCNTATLTLTINTPTLWYADADNDGFGDQAISQSACINPSGYVSNSSDCDPADGTKWQFATFFVDADADGYTNGTASVCSGAGAPVGYSATNSGSDCNDNNNLVWQSNTLYADADGDTYTLGTGTITCYGATLPAGTTLIQNGTDCNDSDATMNATYSFYADTDGDGYGAGSLVSLCAVNSATPPSGYVTNNTDCAPADGTKWQFATFFVDADADGYTNGSASVCSGAGAPAGYSATNSGTDCDDSNNSVWQSNTLYTDADGDTYTVGTGTITCYGSTLPAGTTLTQNDTDCDDSNNSVWQSNTLYTDADGDTYTVGTGTITCYGATLPAGTTLTQNGTDCNDNAYSETNTCGGGSVVNLTMFIEGYYLGGNTMNSVKFNQDGVSPTTDVEDITVNLHDATTYALLYTAVGTLHTDGHLSVTFNTAAAGSYYVAVKGVNVVETWSADPQAIGTTPLNYDFSSAATQAYGSNMRDDDLATGVYLMYQGDINQDGGVDNSDGDPLFIDIENFNYGELATDLTGDGGVDNSDADILLRNSDNFIYSNHP